MRSDPARRCAAVLLDVDGVLVDTDAAVLQLWAEVCAQSKRAAPGADSLVHILGCSVEHTSRHLFPDADDARLTQIAELVRRLEPDLRLVPVPGASDLIDRLHRARLPVALVTGASPARLARVVGALRAEGKIAASVTWGETAGKPDPGPYLLAARRIGVDAGECVVVEDAAAGVLSAVRAGATCLGLAPPGSGRRTDLAGAGATMLVDSLDQLQVGVSEPRLLDLGIGFAARLPGRAGYFVAANDTADARCERS